jgi:hypothetical protein
MRPTTQLLARYIGLFTLIEMGGFLLDRTGALAMARGLLQDRPLCYVLALLLIGLGLAVVLVHNVWRGGVLPIVVTLVGWLMLLRGLGLMLMGPSPVLRAVDALAVPAVYYGYFGALFLLGFYLAAAGWLTKPPVKRSTE